jgi:amino acid adenylation domain-containing protein
VTGPLPRLSAAERARLLDAMQDDLAATPRTSIPARPADVDAPASFAQRRLWFLDRLDPGSSAYNLPIAVRLLGAVDRGALRRAIEIVVERHEVLRTTFAELRGEPVQVVSDAGVEFRTAEPAEATAPVGEADVRSWLSREAFRPFDLAAGPLLRCSLLPLGPRETILLVCAHHSVIDGWSMTVLFEELAACYGALVVGRQPDLAELPLQYADYASWQRGLPGSAIEADLEYWTTNLAGAPPVLELPGDEPATGGRSASGAEGSGADGTAFAGDMLSVELASDVVAGLHRLSADERTTTFMTVLAACQLLFGRLAGTDDVVVGVPIAARPRPELEPLIGNFLNTVAIRTDLSGQPVFRELLRQVRRTTIAAYDHQDVPFERLVEELAPERVASWTPIYQVLVNHTTTRPMPDRLADLVMVPVEIAQPPSKLPLTVYLREQQQPPAVTVDLLYRNAEFGRGRMTGVLDQLRHLLAAVGRDPDRAIGEYSLLAGLPATALPDLDAAIVPVPMPALASMIEEWVSRTPGAPALEWGNLSWSYAELWARSTALRHALGELVLIDPTRPPVVGVTGPRCPATVAAMLAVPTGGGVLLTLDPALPRRRRQQMLSESEARCLISVGVLPDIAPGDEVAVLRVDPAGPEIAEGVSAAPAVVPAGDQAVYLYFTSGTSGTPKGVLGRHRGLTHFLRWQRDTFGVGPGDRCAHLTGLSFDVVLRDVLLPLVSGATLCVPAGDGELGVADCLPWLAGERITVLHTVPALARAYLAERRVDAEPSAALRISFFAGEPLRGDLARQWRETCGGAVVNLYGPTETTLAKCWYRVPDDCGSAVQPVGAAIPGAQAFVRSMSGALAGVGEVGQIVIRTPYRSLGYLGGDGIGRWQANPATGDSEDLLYLTGDLGRLRPDGGLDILGRMDRQVKIRGVRIETDEVASVIEAHPAIGAAVVTAQPDESGQPALVAYLVPETVPGPTPTQLRSYVSKRLPSAMVPSAFVLLERIPRTANGKTDWRALPPVSLQATAEAVFVAPRTATEIMVAGIVASLLGRDRVGVHDSFFDLGGHSLLAMQLVSRIGASCGVTLQLRVVFQAPTVGGIAEAVDSMVGSGTSPLAPIRRAERSRS